MAKTKQKAEVQAEVAPLPVIQSIKGFDHRLQCRGFQFEIGKTYSASGPIEACKNGFHACSGHPFDVWEYYPLTNDAGVLNRYAVVEQSGEMRRDGNKVASASITIKAELSLSEFIKRGVDYIIAHVNWKDAKEYNTGDQSAATNTGNQSAATNTGDWSAATNTGNWSAATNTGYRSAATNTGDRSAATNTGNWSAATNTGYRSAATNTGNQSAATNIGNWSAATNTGNQSAATNTGNWSAATNTGNQSAASVSGKHSVAISTGIESRARADETGAIVLVYRDPDNEWAIKHIFAAKVGESGIKADTWYSLNADGEPFECEVA